MTTTLLGRLHSTRQAATDARHTRERRPLHNRHSRAGGNPAVPSGIRPTNSVSPPRRRCTGRSSVAGRGAIQLDLPTRRFRRGGRNDDYSIRQATLHSAGGHRRPSYPRRRVSSGPKRHSFYQQRLAASTSARGAVIVVGRVPFSSTSHPVDSGPGAGMTTTLLGRLHSARQAATDARHTREGGYPAVRRGIRPINSVSPPRRRREGRSFVAGRGAIQLDLPTP